MIDALTKIEKHLFNAKQYRSSIRKKFSNYETILRIRVNKDYLKQYLKEVKDITDVLFRTLDKTSTYETRNLYFLFAIMETHFNYYSGMVKRVRDITDKQILSLAHDSISQKNNELLQVLINNEKEPVTTEQLEKLLERKNDQ